MNIKTVICAWLGCCVDKDTVPNRYGWKPDLPDHRDVKFTLGETDAPAPLPPKVDHRDTGFLPDVYDQGTIGSCTANSIAAAIQFEMAKGKLDNWTPSRLFIYYYERLMEGSVNSDSGAAIRDGYKVINTNGFAKESTWPYDIHKYRNEPSDDAKAEAVKYKVAQYASVDQTEQAIKSTLAAGYVISFGISVFTGFEDADTARSGIVTMPGYYDSQLGGHAILLVGYDDEKKRFIFRNSWGTKWGDKGYGYLPYQYVLSDKLASDFWVVQLVQEAA